MHLCGSDGDDQGNNCGDWMRGCRAEIHKSQEEAVMIVRQARRQSRIEVLGNVQYRRGHAASAVPDLCVCSFLDSFGA